MQSSDPRHFFETDAAQLTRARRAAKAGNRYGHPVVLKAKVLALLADPASAAHVFVAESAGAARRVPVDDAAPTAAYRGPAAPVTSLALDTTGVGASATTTLFAGCWDKSIWSWDVATRAPGRRFTGGHTDFVKAVVVARLDGRSVLVSGGADKRIVVWDVTTGRRLHTLKDTLGGPTMMAVQDLAVDPVASTADTLLLVSASSDPHIRRWRVRADGWEQLVDVAEATGSAAATAPRSALPAHETTVYKLVFEDCTPADSSDDPDAGSDIDLWTCSGDGTVRCLARQQDFAGSAVDTLIHGDHVRAIAVTDAWIVTAGRDENLQFWDRASGRRYATLSGHYDEVTGLAVLADRRRLCSAGLDGTVRTWPLDRPGIDALVREQEEDRQRGGLADSPDAEPQDGLTAEEEAELAALMDD